MNNNVDIDAVKNLLHKHDYVTVLHKSGDGCIITYPHPRLVNDLPRLVEAFTFKRGDESGFWASTSYDDGPDAERFVELPEYAMRLYVMCEAVSCNVGIPIDPALMVYLDEDGEEKSELEDILEPPSTPEGRKLEGFLYRFVIEARNDGFPPHYAEVAETHGIGVGYKVIRKFYKQESQ